MTIMIVNYVLNFFNVYDSWSQRIGMFILDFLLVLLSLITVLEEYEAYDVLQSITVGKAVVYTFLSAQMIVFIVVMIGTVVDTIVFI